MRASCGREFTFDQGLCSGGSALKCRSKPGKGMVRREDMKSTAIIGNSRSQKWPAIQTSSGFILILPLLL
jgi:hypothetical protein